MSITLRTEDARFLYEVVKADYQENIGDMDAETKRQVIQKLTRLRMALVSEENRDKSIKSFVARVFVADNEDWDSDEYHEWDADDVATFVSEEMWDRTRKEFDHSHKIVGVEVEHSHDFE